MKDEIIFSLDIETLGVVPGSVVTEVGICNNQNEETCHIYLPLTPQVQLGLGSEKETVDWHEKHNPNFAKMDEMCGRVLPQTMAFLMQQLGQIESYLQTQAGEEAFTIWMKSPQFDSIILGYLYHVLGTKLPWGFRDERDVRTIMEIALMVEPDIEMPVKPDNAHDALVDAKFQLEIINACFNEILR